jgi:hypothetical protein
LPGGKIFPSDRALKNDFGKGAQCAAIPRNHAARRGGYFPLSTGRNIEREKVMARALALILALTAGLALPALAVPQSTRIRGTVELIDRDSITVQTSSGNAIKLDLTPETKYATLVKSSLSSIEKGSFIGTATKGSGDFLVALEVHIFPPSLRGTGEGHYAWDRLRDTTLSGPATVSSSMTNGTVERAGSSGAPREVDSTMTNGNVDATAEQNGAKRISVSYKGGQKTILVPPTAPVVAYEPADRSVLRKGAHIFAKVSDDGRKVSADFIAVGQDGLTPPM